MVKQPLQRIPSLGRLYRSFELIYLLLKTGNFHRSFELIYLLLKTGNFRFVDYYTPGDYSSPLPDYKEILARSQVLFEQDTAGCPGIDLREEAQLKLLERFSYYYGDVPFPTHPQETTRYYYENDWFGYADAITLYSVLRHYKPQRIIEIGSGYSSAAMLDVNDLFLENKVHFTFIEPDPERLYNLLRREDKNKHTILQNQVQDVPLEVFRALTANDILFVDSSHVVKVGSDVAHILFDILPELNAGVIIHFHDIFWPFEYPREWMLLGIAYNEAYFLRSFLQYNDAFEIMFFSSFIAKRHADVLREKMPLFPREVHVTLNEVPIMVRPSSLWLKKVI